jgi:hypothetical protein
VKKVGHAWLAVADWICEAHPDRVVAKDQASLYGA